MKDPQRPFWLSLKFYIILIVVVSQLTLVLAYLIFNVGNIYLSWSMAGNSERSTYLASAQKFFDAPHTDQLLPRHLVYKRGQVNFLLGEQQQAVAEWRQFPEAGCWLTVQGVLRLREGKLPEAAEILQTASLLDHASSTIAYYAGMAHYRAGDYNEAMNWLETAVQLNRFDNDCLSYSPSPDVWWPGRPDNLNRPPSLAMTYIQMSAVYYSMRQWSEIQTAAKKAIELEPENPLGYYQLAEAYHRQAPGAGAEQAALLVLAEDIFSEAIEPGSNFQYRMLISLAQIYRAQGNITAATSTYQQALPRVSEPFLLYEIAAFFAETGQQREAASLYELALKNTPLEAANAHRWLEAAAIFAAIDQKAKACEYLQIASGLCPEATCAAVQALYRDNCRN